MLFYRNAVITAFSFPLWNFLFVYVDQISGEGTRSTTYRAAILQLLCGFAYLDMVGSPVIINVRQDFLMKTMDNSVHYTSFDVLTNSSLTFLKVFFLPVVLNNFLLPPTPLPSLDLSPRFISPRSPGLITYVLCIIFARGSFAFHPRTKPSLDVENATKFLLVKL